MENISIACMFFHLFSNFRKNTERKTYKHLHCTVQPTFYNKKFELMLTRRAKAYSSSCSHTVSLSPAISLQLLRGYRFLMPSCAGFLEPRKSRLGLSKSTFNAENFICSFSMSISIAFGAIRSWNVSFSPKSPKNSRSFKVTEFGANREPVYNFLLVISSNLGPILYHLWDTVAKNCKFFPSPLI